MWVPDQAGDKRGIDVFKELSYQTCVSAPIIRTLDAFCQGLSRFLCRMITSCAVFETCMVAAAQAHVHAIPAVVY